MNQDVFHHSVVVVGHMNPAIHTPEYYQILGWIDEPEQRFALEQPNLLRSRAAAQFALRDLVIACGDDRWEIRTSKDAGVDRIHRIACSVWEKLDATPISSFGLNYGFHRAVGRSDVAALLHQMVVRALGFDISGPRPGGSLRYAYGPEYGRVTVSIEPSGLSPEMVFVNINVHHAIQGAGYFSLTEKLEAAYTDDAAIAQLHLDAAMRAMGTGDARGH